MANEDVTLLSSPSLYKIHNELLKHCAAFSSPSGGTTNLIFSPHTLDSALCLLFFGAAGTTHQELRDFYFGGKEKKAVADSLNLGMKHGYSVHKTGKEVFSISSANKLYFEKSVLSGNKVFSEYQKSVEKSFSAGVSGEAVDFASKSEDCRKLINAFVSEATQHKIAELLPASSVSSLTRLVLITALYFKGKWQTPFLPDPIKGSFESLKSTGDTVSQDGVKYMYLRHMGTHKQWIGYSYVPSLDAKNFDENSRMVERTGTGCVFADIPYQVSGGEESADTFSISLVIMMPDNPVALPSYEKAWAANPSLIERCISGLSTPTRGQTYVRLPYITMNKTNNLSVDYKEVFKSLGLSGIFDKATCDFSNINGKLHDLAVDNIYHEASIEIDHIGTEAAAATGIVMNTRCMPLPGPEIIVDRPFAFQVRVSGRRGDPDRSNDIVLFMGRVTDALSLQKGLE